MAEARELQGYVIGSMAQSLVEITMDAIINGRSGSQALAEADRDKARERQAESIRGRNASDQANQHNPQDPPR